MTSRDLTPRWFVFPALVLAWAAYSAYLFLPASGPVMWGGPDSFYRGWEMLLLFFMVPLLWVFAVGDVLFWVGSVLLALGRWRGAAITSLLALLVSGCMVLVALRPGPIYSAIFEKLLAMAVLAVAGGFGWLKFGGPAGRIGQLAAQPRSQAERQGHPASPLAPPSPPVLPTLDDRLAEIADRVQRIEQRLDRPDTPRSGDTA